MASVLLGLFWGFWHMPGWVAWGTVELSAWPLIQKCVHMIPAAVVFTWLYNGSRESLLLVCLHHASIAARWYLLPSLPTSTEKTISWVIAIVVVVAAGPGRLGRPRKPGC